MFGRPQSFLYVVFGISIGLTISMLTSSMNSILWNNLIVRNDNHEHESFNIPGTDRGYTDDNEHQTNDSHHHHDDDTIANQLKKKVRVLCWIMTNPNNLQSKAKHVKHTWGKRCNVMLFMSSTTDPNFPTIGLNVSEGRDHLTGKTMRAFLYVYKNHFNDADWFMKADDDTYVIVENLRYFLSSKNHNAPVYFGHHFKPIVKGGYHSGGAGYVLSKEALRRFAVLGNSKICRADGGAEDVEMGSCLQKLNVTAGKTVDSLGRSRFHCFNPGTHLHGGYPSWFYSYDSNGARSMPNKLQQFSTLLESLMIPESREYNLYLFYFEYSTYTRALSCSFIYKFPKMNLKYLYSYDSNGARSGINNISDYAITFHYVGPREMHTLEFYVYHLRPFGIVSGVQDLNV